jgi:hypothetical protein
MALKLSDVLFNSDRNFEILMKFQLNDEEEFAHLQISIRNHRLYNRYITRFFETTILFCLLVSMFKRRKISDISVFFPEADCCSVAMI